MDRSINNGSEPISEVLKIVQDKEENTQSTCHSRWWTYLKSRFGVRQVTRRTPVGPTVHDFSVEKSSLPRGGEDEFFNDETLRMILRRGISFIQRDVTDHPILLRRGTPKFFDVSPEIISEMCHKQHEKTLYQVISMEKANGENAQISRFDKWWVIASKNVCLLAFNLQDVEKYTEARYRFAREIGRIFFSIIEHIDENKRNELQELCENNTLIGELTGFGQHVVRYQKQDIYFFAIVPKTEYQNDDLICHNPMDAISRLRYFNLSTVDIKYRTGVYSEVVGVNEPTFSKDSEGCVSYVFTNGRVIGLYKAKTRKYQLLRKLRAKAKRLATGGVYADQLLIEFCKEFLKSDDKTVLRELEQTARKLFAYITENGISADEVDQRFIDIIDRSGENEEQLLTPAQKARGSDRPTAIIICCPPFISDTRVAAHEQSTGDCTVARNLLVQGQDVVYVCHSPKIAHQFIGQKRSIRHGHFYMIVIYLGWCDGGLHESLHLSRKRSVDGSVKNQQLITFLKQSDKWDILLEKWKEIRHMIGQTDLKLDIALGIENKKNDESNNKRFRSENGSMQLLIHSREYENESIDAENQKVEGIR